MQMQNLFLISKLKIFKNDLVEDIKSDFFSNLEKKEK